MQEGHPRKARALGRAVALEGQGRVFAGLNGVAACGGVGRRSGGAETGSYADVACLPRTVYRDMTSAPGCRWTQGPWWQREQCEGSHDSQLPFQRMLIDPICTTATSGVDSYLNFLVV